MSHSRRSSGAGGSWEGRNAFQHWYRDNQVYFITARCQSKFHAFRSEPSKRVFWRQFEKYTKEFEFSPFVTSLLDNHYHTIGYLKIGDNLGPMMQRVQGSIAKLVNDGLQAQFVAGELQAPLPGERGADGRLVPFWRDSKNKNYFDGCLRNERQGRLTYRYVLTQCRRHGICEDPAAYPHTRVAIEMDRAIARATELKAFLYGVRYKRYDG